MARTQLVYSRILWISTEKYSGTWGFGSYVDGSGLYCLSSEGPPKLLELKIFANNEILNINNRNLWSHLKPVESQGSSSFDRHMRKILLTTFPISILQEKYKCISHILQRIVQSLPSPSLTSGMILQTSFAGKGSHLRRWMVVHPPSDCLLAEVFPQLW